MSFIRTPVHLIVNYRHADESCVLCTGIPLEHCSLIGEASALLEPVVPPTTCGHDVATRQMGATPSRTWDGAHWADEALDVDWERDARVSCACRRPHSLASSHELLTDRRRLQPARGTAGEPGDVGARPCRGRHVADEVHSVRRVASQTRRVDSQPHLTRGRAQKALRMGAVIFGRVLVAPTPASWKTWPRTLPALRPGGLSGGRWGHATSWPARG